MMRKILRNSFDELNSSPRLERRPLTEVKPNPHNVRKPNREQRRKLEASFLRFGENAPILVDRHSFILAGHARYEALKAMGRTHVWVLVLDHLSDVKARAYAIADNKIGAMSEWNQKKLTTEISDLIEIAEDFEIEDTGFDTGEIDVILQGLAASDPDEQDEFEPRVGQNVSVLGDLWSLGSHRLFCGDARETASYTALMNGEKAAAVFSDPPFNVRVNGHITGKGTQIHREFPSASGEMTEAEFTEFLSLILKLLRDHSGAGALTYIFIDWRHLFELLTAGRAADLSLLNLLVWCKTNAGMGSFYRSRHELILLFKNGRAPHTNNIQLGRHGRTRSNILEYAGANTFPRKGEERGLNHHPTCKPIALVADVILDSTKRDEIVLDAFMGSGTTILAAERTGRRAYGIELDPLYVDTAIDRWQRMTGQKAINQHGQTLEEAARARGIVL
jgi:DNA modification methylase